MLYVSFFFFFSSRRRHTRLQGDWSSDVCSSDLLLQQALLGLPPEQREVFVLREQAGVPFREIAEMVGVNENTVKSRMRYALEGLRKALAAAGGSGEGAPDQPGGGGRLGGGRRTPGSQTCSSTPP